MSLESGQMLRGRVLAREGDMITLQMGRNVMQAATNLPVSVGAFLDLQVQGQQGGKWLLQFVGSQQYTAMSEADLTNMLVDMKLPVNDTSVQLARTMVEFGVPVTHQDMQELTRALAQFPGGASANKELLMAACFLKAGRLPMAPQNVLTLANFMVQNPFIGVQLFQLQQAFRRMIDSGARDAMSKDLSELLGGIPGALNDLALDPRGRNMRKMQQDMRRMAFQAGIEGMGPHAGDDIDMMLWLQSLRQQLSSPGASLPQLADLRALLDDLVDTLAAQRLLNMAVSEQGAFYLQIPLKGGDRTVETRFIYHVDSEGRPVLDPGDVRFDVLVPTESLGDVSWQVTLKGGEVALEVSVPAEYARDHLQRYLPVLVDNLEKMGYHVQAVSCWARGHEEQAGLKPLACKPLETLERVNIQI